MKIYHGAILTVDKDNNVFNYLVEDEGKIVYVGNELPETYKSGELVELGDKCLLPPFVDSHEHLASFAIFHAGLNVMDASSNVEIQDMIRKFMPTFKGKMVVAFGASPYSVKEGKLLSREEIDAVCPDKPFFMVKYDGHACVVNTALLKKIDKKVKDLRGYHPDTGEMNQEAFFAVSDYVTSSISIPSLIKNIKKAIDFHATRGIAMIHDVAGVGFIANLDITLENYIANHLKNGFRVRVFPQSMNVKVATRRKMKRIGGCFECALDGCFGSVDASLNEPYEGTTDCGVLYYSDEKVIDFCKKANRAGLQIEMHAIGDKAFDQATRALKAALDDFPRDDHRHGIIHDCLPTKKGIEICSKYNILMPVQSAFINWKQEPDSYLETILGKDRCNRLNPLKTFVDNDICVSFGSDAPCTEPNPIIWIDKAVNHSTKKEALTIKEAVRCATYNGFYTTFDDKEAGSLEVGKEASFVILSKNIYEVKKTEIKDIKVEALYIKGSKYKNLVD